MLLKEWNKIFVLWRDKLEQFAPSIDELIECAQTDSVTQNTEIVEAFSGKTMEQLIEWTRRNENYLPSKELEIIINTLELLGKSLIDTQVQSISKSIDSLQENILQREKKVQQSCAAVYKLAPLLCAAAAVILW